MRTTTLLLTASLAALVGCSSSGPEDGPDAAAPVSSPRMAIIDYTSDFLAPEAVADYAKADVVIVETSFLWNSERAVEFAARLRELNPDVKLLGYVLAKTCWLRWNEHLDEPFYSSAWYEATRPYWAVTTTGDTLMDWPGQVVLDIIDPDCREAMVSVLADFQARHPIRLDGVMWDYFNPTIWIAPAAAVSVDGDPDLDRDGVAHLDDPDELAAFSRSQEALVAETAARLGADFVQIFNGTRAHGDQAFAALGDGILFELFPTLSFGGGAVMERALDPEWPNNLFNVVTWPRSRNGGPWVILSNMREVLFPDEKGDYSPYNLGNINRVVALLTGATAVYHSDGGITYGWPEVDVDLGAPLGPAVRDGNTLTRAFERGRVTAVLESGSYPVPFDFSIEQDGEVVQSLDMPMAFP